MMKKTMKYLLLGVALQAFCIAGVSEVMAQNTTDVTKTNKSHGAVYVSKPQKASAVPVVKGDDMLYQDMIGKALSLHNLARTIDMQLEEAKEFELAVLNKEVDKARITDFDDCEVALLSKHFKDPDKLWQKLKDKAESLLQQYNATNIEQIADIDERIAKAMALSDEERLAMLEEEKTKDHDVDIDQLLSDFVDSSIEWQVGFLVLNSFYPNQDAWAERITKNTPSLPLWEDQKYLYNRDVWKPKYKEIVNHCRAQKIELTVKEPVIKDEFKYDYYFYDKVKSAHSAFVSAANAQTCSLTKEMREPPEMAPAPLPPVDEEIMILPHTPLEKKIETFPENKKIPVVVQQGSEIVGVYPQNPKNPKQYDRTKYSDEEIQDMPPAFVNDTLWEVYKKESFKDVSKKGEFRLYFDKDLNLTDYAVKATFDDTNTLSDYAINQSANRISIYFELKNAAELSENAYQSFLDNRDIIAEGMNSFIATYQLDIPENLDYLKTEDLQKLKKAVIDKRNAFIAEAKATLGEQANHLDELTLEELEEDKYMAFLRAMEKDPDAKVQLTRTTAVSIEDALKEADANNELMNKYSAESDNVIHQNIVKKNRQFNKNTCLKQDGGVLIDLKKVKIE